MPRTLPIPTHHLRGGGSLIVGLAIAVGLAALAAAFVAIVLWPRWPGDAVEPDAPSLPIVVGGVLFNVPPAAVRLPLQRHAGPQDRVDLVYLWPDLTPPDPALKPAASEGPKAPDRLFLTIAAPNAALVPVDLINEIYPRYFANGPLAGPEGLMVQPFREGTPYQGEDLFFDPMAADPFIARCTRSSGRDLPGTCLLERRLAKTVDVTVRFPRDWLGDWKTLGAGIDHVIATLRPGR